MVDWSLTCEVAVSRTIEERQTNIVAWSAVTVRCERLAVHPTVFNSDYRYRAIVAWLLQVTFWDIYGFDCLQTARRSFGEDTVGSVQLHSRAVQLAPYLGAPR
jgi:hypothetical protein